MGRLDVFVSLSPCDLRAALSCRQPSHCSGLPLHSLLTVLTHLHSCINKTRKKSLSEEKQRSFFPMLMFSTIPNLKLIMIKSYVSFYLGLQRSIILVVAYSMIILAIFSV